MQLVLAATQGRCADPMAMFRAVTFGDKCPGCETGVAVHEAVIAAIDEGGDIVLPQFYALCCACHKEQYIRKYGEAVWSPCVDDVIDNDLKLMKLPPQPIGILSGQVTQIS
jgi:hypothetical protein